MQIYQNKYTYNKFHKSELYNLYIDAIVMRNKIKNDVYIYDFDTFKYPLGIVKVNFDKSTQIIIMQYLYAFMTISRLSIKKYVIMHKSFKEATHLLSNPLIEDSCFYLLFKKMKIKLGLIPIEVFKDGMPCGNSHFHFI